jgi:ribosome-associated protein
VPNDLRPNRASGFVVPEHELQIRSSRSRGPGGQHVNRSSTRVAVRWNVRDTAALSPAERARVLQRLGRRADRDGWVRVVSDRTRSQHSNREDAVGRLTELVRAALHVPKARRATLVPRTERERRLEAKRRRGERKRLRGAVRDDD